MTERDDALAYVRRVLSEAPDEHWVSSWGLRNTSDHRPGLVRWALGSLHRSGEILLRETYLGDYYREPITRGPRAARRREQEEADRLASERAAEIAKEDAILDRLRRADGPVAQVALLHGLRVADNPLGTLRVLVAHGLVTESRHRGRTVYTLTH